MIICGQKIRLTTPERKLLASLTGVDTATITNKRALAEFIQANIEKIRGYQPGADLAYRLMINALPCSDEGCLRCKDECVKFKRLSASSG